MDCTRIRQNFMAHHSPHPRERNVWRLVDLLVKIALDGDQTSHSLRVDTNQFLAVPKQCYGLDPLTEVRSLLVTAGL